MKNSKLFLNFALKQRKMVRGMKTRVFRQFIYIMVLAVAGCTLVSCKEKPMSVDEIYKNDASGVVLIMNRYYYAMNVAGAVVYFTGIDENGELANLTDDINEITRNSAVVFGTGFFVSRDGNILTNRHVVRPEMDKAVVRTVLAKQLVRIKSLFAALRDAAEEHYNQTYYQGIYSGFVDGDRLAELRESFEEYDETVGKIENIDLSDIRIAVSCRVGIAYNGDRVSSPGDFSECTVTKVSGVDDVDLAVIRLNSGKTPKGCYVFHFQSGTKGKRTLLETYWQRIRRDYKGRKLKTGTQLCMIGFNHGPQLAQTSDGLKSQITIGNILQDPDDVRIMYSIPLLEGSSGSPVLNMYGDVVGVNFAKLQGTTSFNFGIPAKKVKEFLGIE